MGSVALLGLDYGQHSLRKKMSFFSAVKNYKTTQNNKSAKLGFINRFGENVKTEFIILLKINI